MATAMWWPASRTSCRWPPPASPLPRCWPSSIAAWPSPAAPTTSPPIRTEGTPMQALTYHGVRDVRVENVPEPGLRAGDDIILRVTATASCGSDLHLYSGKVPRLKGVDTPGLESSG